MRPGAHPLLWVVLAGLAASCGGGAHSLRYRPPEGTERQLEVRIARQSPAGLLVARIEGTGRVRVARGDERELSFTVASSEVRFNGAKITSGEALSALARLDGVELRWTLDDTGALRDEPEVHGARDGDDAAVHVALLDDLIQSSGALPPFAVDVGESWSQPWHLHSLAADTRLNGSLTATLVSMAEGVATIDLGGTLEFPRQTLDDGWSLEGAGSARGRTLVDATTGVLLSSVVTIRVESAGTNPDGAESTVTTNVEIDIREAGHPAPSPQSALLACDGFLQTVVWPRLSQSGAGDALIYSRPAGARVVASTGEEIAPLASALVRLEADAAFVDGAPTSDLLLWAREAGDEATASIVLDVAPDVSLSRVAEVAALSAAPRLLVEIPPEHDVESLRQALAPHAGQCEALTVALEVATEEDVLRPRYTLAEGARAALGACACGGIADQAKTALSSIVSGLVLRAIPIDAARLAAADRDATAADLPELLMEATEAANTDDEPADTGSETTEDEE